MRAFRVKKKRNLLLVLSLILIIAGGIVVTFILRERKNIFGNKEAVSLSQERWLYWCDSQETVPCFYVARDGSLMGEAPRLSGTVFPKFYGNREALAAALPFVQRFYAFGKFVITDNNTLEVGWPGTMQIKLSLKDNPERIAENLALILEKEIGERKDEVDYIDLRLGNRVYYKWKTKN